MWRATISLVLVAVTTLAVAEEELSLKEQIEQRLQQLEQQETLVQEAVKAEATYDPPTGVFHVSSARVRLSRLFPNKICKNY